MANSCDLFTNVNNQCNVRAGKIKAARCKEVKRASSKASNEVVVVKVHEDKVAEAEAEALEVVEAGCKVVAPLAGVDNELLD